MNVNINFNTDWQTDRVTYRDTPCLKFWAWRKAAGRVQRRFSARGGPGQGDVKYLKKWFHTAIIDILPDPFLAQNILLKQNEFLLSFYLWKVLWKLQFCGNLRLEKHQFNFSPTFALCHLKMLTSNPVVLCFMLWFGRF